jgi:hypothetical protein
LRITVDYLGHIKHSLGVQQAESVELKENALVCDLLSLLAEVHGEPFRKAVYEPKGLDLKPDYIREWVAAESAGWIGDSA